MNINPRTEKEFTYYKDRCLEMIAKLEDRYERDMWHLDPGIDNKFSSASRNKNVIEMKIVYSQLLEWIDGNEGRK